MTYKLVLVSPLSLWTTLVSSSPRSWMECLLFSLLPVVLWLLVQDLRSSRMLHSRVDWHLVTDVSGHCRSHLQGSSTWPFNMKPTGCPEKSVTTNQRCVTSHKANFSLRPRGTPGITLRPFHCTWNSQSLSDTTVSMAIQSGPPAISRNNTFVLPVISGTLFGLKSRRQWYKCLPLRDTIEV